MDEIGQHEDYSFYDLDEEALVRPSDLLIGDARGHRYKSIDRDLGNGQRNVLQTMLAAREVIPQVSQRRAMLEGSLKQANQNLSDTTAAVREKFIVARELLAELEEAAVAHLETSHVQSLPVLSQELEKVKSIENGVMSWHETVKAYIEGNNLESTPPPEVVNAEQRLKGLILMPMDHVEIPSVRERLDTTVIDAATQSFKDAIQLRQYVAEFESTSCSPSGSPQHKAPRLCGRLRPLTDTPSGSSQDHLTLHGQQVVMDSPSHNPEQEVPSLLAHRGLMNRSKAATLRCLKQVTAHDNWVTALCHGDGVLYSASWDKTIQLWDPETLESLGGMPAHTGRIRALVVASNHLFSASDDQSIKVWSVKNLCCVATLKDHQGWVVALDASPRFLASGSADTKIILWDVAGFVKLGTLSGHTGAVNAVQWLGDHRLFSGGADGTIKAWDLSDGVTQARCEISIEAHENWVWGLAVDPATGRVYSSADDDVIKVWEGHDLSEVGQCNGHYNWIRCLHIAGQYLYSGGDDKTIKIWDKDSFKCNATLPTKSGAVHSLVAIGDWVVSGTSSNDIHLWGP